MVAPKHVVVTSGSNSVFGRLFLTLFLSCFLAAGLFFAWMIGREFVRALDTRFWKATPCTILSAEVLPLDRDEGGYRVDAAYSYTVASQQFTNRTISSDAKTFSDYGEAARLVASYLASRETNCWVNPKVPNDAMLVRPSLGKGFFILLPLVFIAIGAGGIFLTWRTPPLEETTLAEKLGPKSELPAKGRGCLIFFFGIFFLVGLVAFYFAFIRPVMGIVQASKWTTVPCTIVSSEVRSHRGDDSTTYSVDILYSYVVNDREHRANRYSFAQGSSSGREGKERIVAAHPPGSSHVCYVDPAEPHRAVLNRDFTPGVWVGALPLIFVVAGLVGMIFAGRRKSVVPVVPHVSVGPVPGKPTLTGSLVLKPQSGRWAKFGVLCFFGLFWNGIVSVFVFSVVKDFGPKGIQWFPTIFLIPFVLIGLLVMVGVAYQFLCLFNPQPILTLSNGVLIPGQSVDLKWSWSGRVQRVRDLEIVLEGREEVTYRQGTSTSTDKSVFYRHSVVKTSHPGQIASGSTRFELPTDAVMHSFTAPNNKIIWTLSVTGTIERWPDIGDEFVVQLAPWIERV